MKIKVEPRDVYRMNKPGKYSKKANRGKEEDNRQKISKSKRCIYCSSTRCEGDKKCPGRRGTCFACQKRGHFRGADVCKKTQPRSTRRVSEDSSSSSQEIEETSSEEQESDSGEETEVLEKEVKRVQATRIPTIRMIGDRRYPKIRKTSSKYRIKVMIKEQIVPV